MTVHIHSYFSVVSDLTACPEINKTKIHEKKMCDYFTMTKNRRPKKKLEKLNTSRDFEKKIVHAFISNFDSKYINNNNNLCFIYYSHLFTNSLYVNKL